MLLREDSPRVQMGQNLRRVQAPCACKRVRRHTAVAHATRERLFAYRPYRAIRKGLAKKVNAQNKA